MTSLHLTQILDHWAVGRTRGLLEPNASTLRQMSHLPPHLVDDVNARGFPPDRVYDQMQQPHPETENRPASRKTMRIV